jgi:hypothetical protein
MSPVGDVRAFYAALGIELSGWRQANAAVRCFADPAAHEHEDRNPSCSVSLAHGAWRCWACGARGGAYDAALARGHTPASAMQLLVRYGLAEPGHDTHPLRRARRPGTQTARPSQRPQPASGALATTDAAVATWHATLLGEPGHRQRQLLSRQRLWSPAVIRELELGYDGSRITIPIHNGAGQLRGVLRYQPGGRPKMLTVPGTRLGLIPHPAAEPSRRTLLVEGPPDMIAARSRGWPAIAVPGDHAWQARWAPLLSGREVLLVMDSDRAGRAAAQRIASDLHAVCAVRVIDLAPTRDDGFDLTNWLHAHPQQRRSRCTTSLSSKPTITP